MSTLKVGGIRGVSASSDAITVANDGTATGNFTNRKGKNLVINGAMEVAQRGTSSTSGGYQTVDRIEVGFADTDENPTQSQVDVASGTTPYTSGFRKAYRITNGNQTSGAGTSDIIDIKYSIESQDVAKSGWNYTSSSSNVTLQFWIKSSVAQNFFGHLVTNDGTSQNYPFETGSLSADTWTKVTKTIPGNSNLQFDNDTGKGLEIRILPFAGTGRTASSATLNQWAAYDGAARTPDNTSTWYTTNDATLEITGVQLEVGSVATDFEFRSFHEELLKCFRYYNKKNPGYGRIGHCITGTSIVFTMDLPCEMRASPTITNEGGLYFATQNGVALGLTGISHGSAATTTARITLDVNSNGSAGNNAFIWSGNTFYILDSEL